MNLKNLNAKLYNLIVSIFFILFFNISCVMTEKQACYHDIKLEGGPKEAIECLLLPLYYESAINDLGRTEKEKESLLYSKKSLISSCLEDWIKSEKCKKESNFQFTIRS
ncbi:hypothetical protein P3G55_18425 [Leptospira sp. 96542]|nr:hypothetical protein [Leptospira sp. 96542]